MSQDRFLVLALAEVRAAWPTDLARWCLGGELPIEFLPCISAAELQVRVSEGRACSLVLLDGRLWAREERDLVAILVRSQIPLVVVDPDPRGSEPTAYTDTAAIAPPNDPVQLEAVVRTYGTPLRDITAAPEITLRPQHEGWQAPLVAVTGTPGSGRSTIAAALTQQLATEARFACDVTLGDFCRRAHLALLHDAGDVMPALTELVELSRAGRPNRDQINGVLYAIPERGYRLLLGMRHPSDWTTLRQAAVADALRALRGATRLVVADVDADVSGEAETGSFDIEDRHALSRDLIGQADVVVATTLPTMTGLVGLGQVIQSHRRYGVPPARQIVAVNRAPRSPRTRHQLTEAIHRACNTVGDATLRTVVFVGERKAVERIHRDRTRFPEALAGSLATFVLAHIDESAGDEARANPEPAPIGVGTLGVVRTGRGL